MSIYMSQALSVLGNGDMKVNKTKGETHNKQINTQTHTMSGDNKN